MFRLAEQINKEIKMSNEAMFEWATRNKVRFASSRGELNVEVLWDVPLRSKEGDDFNLDNIAKTAHQALKDVSEGSFVNKRVSTPKQERLARQLDIITYVIDVKLEEEKSARDKAAKKKEKEALTGALAAKEEEELLGLSKQQIKNRISKLED